MAVEAKVPRYLLVSSAFVARPFHPIALMLSAYVDCLVSVPASVVSMHLNTHTPKSCE